MQISYKTLVAITLATEIIGFAQLPGVVDRTMRRVRKDPAAPTRESSPAESSAETPRSRSRTRGESAAAAEAASPLAKKIVFAKVDRKPGQLQEADIANEFVLGAPLFFHVYMAEPAPKTLEAVSKGESLNDIAMGLQFLMRFTVAGKAPIEAKFAQFGTRMKNLEMTSWRGFFIRDADADLSSDMGGDVFREFLTRATQKGMLVPGKNVVKVEVIPMNTLRDKSTVMGDVVASGELTLDYKAGSIVASNKDLCVPYPAAQNDAALEGQMLRIAQATWKSTEYKPAQIRLTTGGWLIRRHPVSGIILNREVEALVISRGAEYCNYRGYKYAQTFEGSAYNPQGIFTNKEQTPHYLPCGCLAK